MKLNPNRTALLVIDMQGGFIDPASPTCIPTARATIPACAAVQDKARALGIPVLEEPFTVKEMMEADEVFFTSASALCCRIREIDGRSDGGKAPGLIKRIQDAACAEALSEVEALRTAVSR